MVIAAQIDPDSNGIIRIASAMHSEGDGSLCVSKYLRLSGSSEMTLQVRESKTTPSTIFLRTKQSSVPLFTLRLSHTYATWWPRLSILYAGAYRANSHVAMKRVRA